MNKIKVNGIELTEKSIETVRTWQEDGYLNDTIEFLDKMTDMLISDNIPETLSNSDLCLNYLREIRSLEKQLSTFNF